MFNKILRVHSCLELEDGLWRRAAAAKATVSESRLVTFHSHAHLSHFKFARHRDWQKWLGVDSEWRLDRKRCLRTCQSVFYFVRSATTSWPFQLQVESKLRLAVNPETENNKWKKWICLDLELRRNYLNGRISIEKRLLDNTGAETALNPSVAVLIFLRILEEKVCTVL